MHKIFLLFTTLSCLPVNIATITEELATEELATENGLTVNNEVEKNEEKEIERDGEGEETISVSYEHYQYLLKKTKTQLDRQIQDVSYSRIGIALSENECDLCTLSMEDLLVYLLGDVAGSKGILSINKAKEFVMQNIKKDTEAILMAYSDALKSVRFQETKLKVMMSRLERYTINKNLIEDSLFPDSGTLTEGSLLLQKLLTEPGTNSSSMSRNLASVYEDRVKGEMTDDKFQQGRRLRRIPDSSDGINMKEDGGNYMKRDGSTKLKKNDKHETDNKLVINEKDAIDHKDGNGNDDGNDTDVIQTEELSDDLEGDGAGLDDDDDDIDNGTLDDDIIDDEVDDNGVDYDGLDNNDELDDESEELFDSAEIELRKISSYAAYGNRMESKFVQRLPKIFTNEDLSFNLMRLGYKLKRWRDERVLNTETMRCIIKFENAGIDTVDDLFEKTNIMSILLSYDFIHEANLQIAMLKEFLKNYEENGLSAEPHNHVDVDLSLVQPDYYLMSPPISTNDQTYRNITAPMCQLASCHFRTKWLQTTHLIGEERANLIQDLAYGEEHEGFDKGLYVAYVMSDLDDSVENMKKYLTTIQKQTKLHNAKQSVTNLGDIRVGDCTDRHSAEWMGLDILFGLATSGVGLPVYGTAGSAAHGISFSTNSMIRNHYSPRFPWWNMPNEYYKVQHTMTNSNGVQFSVCSVHIDTWNLLIGWPYYTNTSKCQTQLEWLNTTLASCAIEARWTIVYGHHPIVSSAPEADTGTPLHWLLTSILRAYKVHLYVSSNHKVNEILQHPGDHTVMAVVGMTTGSLDGLAPHRKASHWLAKSVGKPGQYVIKTVKNILDPFRLIKKRTKSRYSIWEDHTSQSYLKIRVTYDSMKLQFIATQDGRQLHEEVIEPQRGLYDLGITAIDEEMAREKQYIIQQYNKIRGTPLATKLFDTEHADAILLMADTIRDQNDAVTDDTLTKDEMSLINQLVEHKRQKQIEALTKSVAGNSINVDAILNSYIQTIPKDTMFVHDQLMALDGISSTKIRMGLKKSQLWKHTKNIDIQVAEIIGLISNQMADQLFRQGSENIDIDGDDNNSSENSTNTIVPKDDTATKVLNDADNTYNADEHDETDNIIDEESDYDQEVAD